MSTATQLSMIALLAVTLAGGVACSDRTDKVNQSGGSANNGTALASPSDASRSEDAKTDAGFNDLVLAAKVKSRILKDASLRSSDIYVDAQGGTVVLTGSVDNKQDADRAVEVARSVDDVQSVENKLAVRSGG